MAQATFTHESFVGGEWSLTAQGAITDPKYRTAMTRCLNYFPTESGALTRRPGSRHVAATYQGLPGRVVSFDIKESYPYTMEFTSGNLRFINDTRLATTNDPQTVTAISTANPAVCTTGTHGWSSGDQVYFTTLGTADPYLLNRRFTITVTDTTHFSLADSLTGTTLDGSLLKTFTTGVLARVNIIVTPYTGDKWPTLRSVQAELSAVLLEGGIAPNILTATLPTVAGNDATFSLSAAQFVDGPYLDPITQATVTPASTSGIVGMTIVSPTWSSTSPYNLDDFVVYSGTVYKSLIPTNLNNQPDTATFAWVATTQDKVVGANGLQTTDIGRHIRLFSEPAAWAIGTTYAAGNSVKYNNAYWTSVVGTNTGNRPGLDVTKWAPNPAAAQWTWGKITSLTGAVATMVAIGAGQLFSAAGLFSGNELNTDYGAFNGFVNQTYINGAKFTGLDGSTVEFTVGKVFSSGQAVSYVIVTAPNDRGFVTWESSAGQAAGSVTINLRGKSTIPTGVTDGTILGNAVGINPNIAGAQVQIFSSDAATAFKYLWIELVVTRGQNANYYGVSACCIGQVQIFTAAPFSGTGISAQIFGPPLLYTTAITTWRLGLFNDQYGWPKNGTYHEGRLWLSGMVDNRLDASALVDINNNPATSLFYFTPTLYDGTVSDACAIDYTLDGPGVNSVFWMEPDQQGVIVGTQAGEWLVQATAINQVLTPLNIQAHRVTKIGCANIEPRRAEHTLLLVQTHLRKIVEYFADIFSGKFTAPNLSEKAKHLTVTGLSEIAYQQELTPVLWARRADGRLVGMTYKRDTLMTSQGPTFAGWHQHTLGSGRTVESITVGPNADGTLPALSMVTNDANTSVRHIEVMTPQFEEGDALTAAWFLDDAIGTVAYETATVNGNPGINIYGVWHLNGKTATVFAGGVDAGDWAVANGAVFVPFYPGGGQTNALFTSAFVSGFSGAMPVVVGFTYTSQGQLVRPDGPELGARNGPGVGKIRRIQKFVANLVNTLGMSFGTRFAKMEPIIPKTTGGTPLAGNAMYTGLYKDNVSDDAEAFASQLAWQQTRPFPGTIASLTGFGNTADE